MLMKKHLFDAFFLRHQQIVVRLGATFDVSPFFGRNTKAKHLRGERMTLDQSELAADEIPSVQASEVPLAYTGLS